MVARVTRSKDIGTRAETQVVRFLAANGWPSAERRALHGSLDQGDVTGTPGLVWEVKGGEAAKCASDKLISAWFDEAQVEARNAGADYGFLVVQRRQKNERDWWAVIGVCDLASLIAEEPITYSSLHCRITLKQLVELLAGSGWTSGDTRTLEDQ